MIGLLMAMLAVQVEIGPPECTRPSPDDMRPYTLCLAETNDDEIERQLNQQVHLTLGYVKQTRGDSAVSRMRAQQRLWERQRNRKCAADVAEAPIPEQAREELTCRAMRAKLRISVLKAMRSR